MSNSQLTRAEQLVDSYAQRFKRGGVSMGMDANGEENFPFMITDDAKQKIGLLALAAFPGGEVQLQDIHSFRKGSGRTMLNELCGRADMLGVRLRLTVSNMWEDEPGALSADALRDWYARHGFVCEVPPGGEWVREPRTRSVDC